MALLVAFAIIAALIPPGNDLALNMRTIRLFFSSLVFVAVWMLLLVELPVLALGYLASRLKIFKWLTDLSEGLISFNGRAYAWVTRIISKIDSKSASASPFKQAKMEPNALIHPHRPEGFSAKRYANLPLIFYYEPAFLPTINKHLAKRHAEIRERAAARNRVYLNLGVLTGAESKEFIAYCFPYQFRKLSDPSKGLTQLTGAYSLLLQGFCLPDPGQPCFMVQQSRATHYDIYWLPEDPKLLEEAIDNFLRSLSYHQLGNPAVSQSRRAIRRNPDIDHPRIEISAELQADIKHLLELHKDAPAMEFLAAILKELHSQGKIEDPKIANIAEAFAAAPSTPLSPLHIRANGELYLPDYQLTLYLTPLQKTVYLFFLKHPEGMLFKDLASHRDEMLEIYKKFATRKDDQMLLESVADLANPFSNSMSEKCSRIKEVFLRHLGDDIAQMYYVKGERLSPKSINLPRELVVYEL